MKIAIYPGSFDPITLGHLNIVKRAAAIFDKVIVCVMINSSKTPMFNLEERVELIRRVVSRFDNVEVDTSSKMLVEYARSRGATAVVKGLRVMSDFEAEFQMALINKLVLIFLKYDCAKYTHQYRRCCTKQICFRFWRTAVDQNSSHKTYIVIHWV